MNTFLAIIVLLLWVIPELKRIAKALEDLSAHAAELNNQLYSLESFIRNKR